MPAADALAARLQALEDREAIRDIIARYGPAAASGDSDGVAALFDEAGVYAGGGNRLCPRDGRIDVTDRGAHHRGVTAERMREFVRTQDTEHRQGRARARETPKELAHRGLLNPAPRARVAAKVRPAGA